MEWKQLIQRRVYDAIQRSLSRGCGLEKKEALEKEATQLLIHQQYLCALCGCKLTNKKGLPTTASLDRVFSSVKPSPTRKMCGYLKNCRWVCWTCNHKTRACHMKNPKWKDEILCTL